MSKPIPLELNQTATLRSLSLAAGGNGLDEYNRGIWMLFGIEDPQIILAYVLSIGVTIVCVIYGWFKWNKEED